MTYLCVSPDNSVVISGSNDKTAFVWDISDPASASCTAILAHYVKFYSAFISPDMRSIVTASANGWQHWDASTYICTLINYLNCYLTCGSFSPDGSLVAFGNEDNNVIVLRVAATTCIATLKGHTGFVLSICISSDNTVAVPGSNDGTMHIWDIVAVTCRSVLSDHEWSFYRACLSSDNSFIVSGSLDETIKIWKVASAACTATLKGHVAGVLSVCISSDMTTIVTGSLDKTVRVWDVASRKCTAKLRHDTAVHSVCITADNASIIVGTENEVRLWSATK